MAPSSEIILGFHPQQLIDDGLDMYKYLDMRLSSKYMSHLFQFFEHDDGSGICSGFEGLLAIKNRGYRFVLTSSKLYKAENIWFALSITMVDYTPLKLERIIVQGLFLRRNFERFASLTLREKEVLRLLALGFSNKEIVEQLFNSVRTINAHRVNMHKKPTIKTISDIYKYANSFDLI